MKFSFLAIRDAAFQVFQGTRQPGLAVRLQDGGDIDQIIDRERCFTETES